MDVNTAAGMESLSARGLRAVRRAIAEVRDGGGGQAQIAAGKGLAAYAFATGQNITWEYAENYGAPIAAGVVPLIKPEGESGDSTEDDDNDDEAAARPSLDEPEDGEPVASAEIVSAGERAIYEDYGLQNLLDLTEEQRAALFAELERAIAAHSATHLLRFGSETIATAELCRLARDQNFAQYMDEGWADRVLFLNKCKAK